MSSEMTESTDTQLSGDGRPSEDFPAVADPYRRELFGRA
jgi:hypothetical protein